MSLVLISAYILITGEATEKYDKPSQTSVNIVNAVHRLHLNKII